MPAWLTAPVLAAARWAALGAAILMILFGVRKSGRDAERVDSLKATLESKDAQDRAAARSPRDPHGVADRLRNGEF